MPLPALRRAALFATTVAVCLAGTASGALVEVEDVVLRADGGFKPQTLPRDRFAPVDFHGYLDVSAKGGGRSSPLRQALIDFDRDGRLSVAGLPTCAAESIAEATTESARARCRGALVGTGKIEVLISTLDQGTGTLRQESELTVFNGPRTGGWPTAVAHARLGTQTYAITIPIETRRGGFRYRARIEVPPIAGGAAAISRVEVKIGRRYRAGGQRRSYASARCSDNVLHTHGRFTFESGTVVDGSVEKYCRSK